MKPLVVIPARGGSKRLPGKNIKLLYGKPLIHYTIEAARKVFADEVICVSTDDEEIKRSAELTGIAVPFTRPSQLSTDTATTYDVLTHAIDFYKDKGYEADRVVLLQPTSPLRTAKHISEALALYDDSIDMVVSVKETASNPYYVLFEETEQGFLKKSKEGNFVRRQDCPQVWEYNGSVYVISIKSLLLHGDFAFPRIKAYKMTESDSIDIDTIEDFQIAEIRMKIIDQNKS